MLQKGKYKKVSSEVDDIAKDWREGGRGQGQGSRSPHRRGGGFRAGKETFFVGFVLTSCTALCFVKFLISFVLISLLFCCLRLRIDLIPFLLFAVT